ncbi:MAG: PAS domain S-box protein, partial [Sedimentisphaerales bacterium]|nr:PAS domain S-box protein [Sedimentisphaerales bacterium]
DIHPKEFLDHVLAEFEAQVRGEKLLSPDLPCLRKDGTLFYANISGILMVLDGRKCNVGFFTDITERKHAEEALQASESKYRTLLESLPQKIFLKDRNSVYLSCNDHYARDLKIEAEQIAGRTDYDFHPKELAEKYRADDQRIMQSGQAENIEEKYILYGQEVSVQTVKTPVKDEHGNVSGVLGIFWDITERKKAETALKESEQRLSIVLNSILTGVVIVDAQTHEIVDCNPLATELIGLAREEIIGKLCHKFICPAEKRKCPISDLGQIVDKSERVLIRGDGKEMPILKTVTSTSWQGREYFVESFVDITERKQAEKALEKLNKDLELAVLNLGRSNKELQDFAYVVSHDLKAPLRGIKTLAQWITTDYAERLDQNGKEQMNLLLSRVDRMHNLIDGILQYSRVGRVKENKVQINLNELVSEVTDMVAPPENISITVENELPVIEFERTRITQVFQNLLSNAVKFMDKPEGQVKIGCVEEDGFWKFTVADNGPGIEEKYFEKIFEMFQTLAPRDDVESTGVGLTVAKKIVELYGGRIWVESKVGEGSTFFFTLPKQKTEVKDAQLQASIVG